MKASLWSDHRSEKRKIRYRVQCRRRPTDVAAANASHCLMLNAGAMPSPLASTGRRRAEAGKEPPNRKAAPVTDTSAATKNGLPESALGHRGEGRKLVARLGCSAVV